MKVVNKKNPGYIIFSLDTELAIGFFDKDKRRANIFAPDGSNERQAVRRLLEIFDETDTIATWALVGHMFYSHCEHCKICPMKKWEGKYKSFREVYGTNNPNWYGADLIEYLISHKKNHELAFHGYSHMIFKETSMTRADATIEIEEWFRAGSRFGLKPRSIVFPRDQIGHLSLLKEYGFIAYRSEEPYPRIYDFQPGRIFKYLDHILGLSTAPVYSFDEITTKPLVNLHASQHIFGFNRYLENFLDIIGLPFIRLRRIEKAIRKAALEGKIVHIWAHPWEFRKESDYQKIRRILLVAQEEIKAGNLISIGMTELAEKILEYKSKK